MKNIKHLLTLLALTALGTTAWAQEVYVSDEASLRDAIANQPAGTTIVIAADFNINGEYTELVVNKSFILDLNGKTLTATRHIRVASSVIGSNTLPSTLEIWDNSTEGGGTIIGKYPGDGCAIYIDESNTLEIYGGTIKGDVNSTHNGGVIYNAGTLTMYDGKITDGYAANGGGVYNAGTMTLDNGGDGGSIENCTATSNGGGIYNAGTLTIKRGTIGGIDETDPDNPVSLGNTATSDGGGIYTYNGTININGGSSNNSAAGHGGGIQSYHSTISMTNGSISGNAATTSGTSNAGGVNLTNESNMTMSGGSISDNTAGKDYGGVYVGGGDTPSSFIMTGGSIANNIAQHNYGGIRVNGTMTMTGGSVTGNTAANLYGGIDVDGTLIMSGNPIVMGNTVNGNSENVRLPEGKKITVDGAFTSGASVGVTCADGVGTTFTLGYGTYTHEQGSVFASDNTAYTVAIESNEAKLVAYDPTAVTGPVQYLNVDADGDHGMAECSTYTLMSTLTDNGVTLSNGWYVVDKNLTFNKRITISGTVNLILMDNTRLTANKGVFVPSGATLHIWGQSTKETDPNDMMGILNATANEKNYSGIGGSCDTHVAGFLFFHGGFCSGVGGENAAGIRGAVGFEDNYTVRIYGGNVFGVGGKYGAGIGGGKLEMVGSILITGGNVFGHDGYKGAGIGSGFGGKMHDMKIGDGYSGLPGDHKTYIRITGGYVIGCGTTGAGIGGGEGHDTFDGDPAIVYIEGGTVEARTDDGGVITQEGGGRMGAAVAIGWGYDGQGETGDYIHFYDGAKISASTSIHGNLTLQTAANGRSKYKTYKQIKIEPCDHPNGTNYSNNGNSLDVGCNHCHTTEPYTFTTAGNWNTAGNWLGSIMPGEGKDVAVKAAATIPSNCCAHVGHIDMQEGGSLTIADGGQLKHSNAGVTATVEKHIAARSTVEGVNKGWAFIASPVTTDLTPSSDNHITDNSYDLYRFNQSAALEWENYKANHADFTTLVNGRGYLYNNSVAVDLAFNGVLRPATADTMALVYDDEAEFAGWNLVGNPFAFNAYVNQSYYIMDADGTAILPTEQTGRTVAPCTGIMVKATGSGQKVVFSDAPMTSAPSNGSLNIALSQVVEPAETPVNRGDDPSTSSGTLTLDKAIVSFNEGNELGKFYFGEQNANIYIPQGGEEYAIASVSAGRDVARYVSTEVNEIPVNFKANADGTYTLSLSSEEVSFSYLHLIDNLTGNDVDLLATPSYTFNAKTSDYASRFRLVFVCGDANDDNDGDNAFAFFSNGEIIVNGEGVLQVVDMMGRVIVCTDVARNVSTQGMTPGVYVLRLVNGDNVRTQKIIIE